MKQYLRKMDWMIVGDSLWERLQLVQHLLRHALEVGSEN